MLQKRIRVCRLPTIMSIAITVSSVATTAVPFACLRCAVITRRAMRPRAGTLRAPRPRAPAAAAAVAAAAVSLFRASTLATALASRTNTACSRHARCTRVDAAAAGGRRAAGLRTAACSRCRTQGHRLGGGLGVGHRGREPREHADAPKRGHQHAAIGQRQQATRCIQSGVCGSAVVIALPSD